MPRNVRNLWITADIDGQAASLSGGPRAATGGMQVTLQQRDRGEVTAVLSLLCYVDPDGTIHTKVLDETNGSRVVHHVVTTR